MSNLSRLEAVSASLDTAINKANSLPDVGSGGGASVETCTITVGVTSGSSAYCTYTKCENGVTTYEATVPTTVSGKVGDDFCDAFTLVNVVCGSTVFVQQSDSGTISNTDNTVLLQSWNNGRYFVFRPSAGSYITMYE